jgi:hypothetical protein
MAKISGWSDPARETALLGDISLDARCTGFQGRLTSGRRSICCVSG